MANSELETLKIKYEALKAELSLAKQDRDSWKNNWKVSQDAANGLIEKLTARAEAAEKRIKFW